MSAPETRILTRPRIGFLTSSGSGDRRSWSGTHHRMYRALRKHGGDVVHLGPLRTRWSACGRAVDRVLRTLSLPRYDYSHSVVASRACAAQVRRKLQVQPVDVIFAPAASTELAYLDADVPVVYGGDTTFALLESYYESFSRLLPVSRREGHHIEQRAVERAQLLLYATEWAARSAVRDYGADPGRIRIVPFGANLDHLPVNAAIRRGAAPGAPCRLLFLGREWERKGGDVALQVLEQLRELGIESRLTVCGCTPPPGQGHPWLEVVPPLDPEDGLRERSLARLLENSDFLLLPTRAECFGIVFAEANAYGVPAITRATGGVPEVVLHGKNGLVLPEDAGADRYAEAIVKLWRDPEAYRELRRSSREAYEVRLNWDVWADSVLRLIGEVHAEHRRSAGSRH